MIFFPFYTGDWIRDTSDLDADEEGIYIRLLCWYYSTEQKIPGDRAHNIARSDQQKTQWVLSRFFVGCDSDGVETDKGKVTHWKNERADKEIKKAQKRIKSAKENGKMGGRPKKTQTHQKPSGLLSANPLGKLSPNPKETQHETSPQPQDLSSSSLRSEEATDSSILLSDTVSNSSEIEASSGTVQIKSKRRSKKASGKLTVINPTPGSKVWTAYSEAYLHRYGAEPVRNAKTNSLCVEIVRRIGEQEAPDVAAWYVGSDNSYYVSRGHSLQCLVADCEKIRTEWVTGRRITQSQARVKDRTQALGDVAKSLLAKYEEEERSRDGKV